MKDTYVWDLDGTLACGQHRLHLLPTKDTDRTESWFPFNAACYKDPVIVDNALLYRALRNAGKRIIILTGRSDDVYYQTYEWLKQNNLDGYDRLIMRKADDHRRDTEFKEAELRRIGLNRIICCFDDLEHVVKHMRSLGLTAHQVTHYDNPKVSERPRDN